MNVSSSTAQHEMEIWLSDCSFNEDSAAAHGLDIFIYSDNQPPQKAFFDATCTFTSSSHDRIYWKTLSCDGWINNLTSSTSSKPYQIIIIVSSIAVAVTFALVGICFSVYTMKHRNSVVEVKRDEIELSTSRLADSDGFMSSDIADTFVNTQLPSIGVDLSKPQTDVIEPIIEDN